MKLYAQRLARQRHEEGRKTPMKITVEEASVQRPRVTRREKRSTGLGALGGKRTRGHDRGLTGNAKDRAHLSARGAAGADHPASAAIVPVTRAISPAKLAANRR